MLVYGNPRQRASGDAVFAQLIGCANSRSLDELRASLIRAGQLEQALADAPDPLARETLLAAEGLTDHFAAAFYARCRGQDSPAIQIQEHPVPT